MTHLNDITTGTNVSTRSKGSHLTIDDRVKISVLKFNKWDDIRYLQGFR